MLEGNSKPQLHQSSTGTGTMNTITYFPPLMEFHGVPEFQAFVHVLGVVFETWQKLWSAIQCQSGGNHRNPQRELFAPCGNFGEG